MVCPNQIAPWNRQPYSLVSWWEVEQFAAAAFIHISQSLAELRSQLGKISDAQVLWSILPGGSDPSFLFIGAIKDSCLKIGLRTSAHCADEIQQNFQTGITAAILRSSLQELDNTIRREMTTHWFFHLDETRAQFYKQSDLFGADVNVKFPSIAFDMEEAGNCYAMGRGTACVFHLMRIMEIGVQTFGTVLGVSMTGEKNWQNILDEANKAIRGMNHKETRTKELSEVSANLYAVKLAWRNEVMHPKETYTLEEAENLIRQVRLFMGQLAKVT